jgi:2-dehydro-3-deoxy-D-gluconate 5-dehydrogenase
MDLFSIKNKKAIVIGASGDLGYAMFEALLEAGCVVVGLDINPNIIERSSTLNSLGFKSYGLVVDISSAKQIKESVEKSKELLGGDINIMINCAGIQRRYSSEEFPLEEWKKVLEVNLTSALIYSQEVFKSMIRAGGGKIIHVTSIMDTFGGITIPAYAASKGGLTQLIKALSNDWANKGICVNGIAPGYFNTQLNTNLLNDKKRVEEVIQRTPMNRWGEPSDIKGLAIFLSSNASDYITGTVIKIDGGYSVR